MYPSLLLKDNVGFFFKIIPQHRVQKYVYIYIYISLYINSMNFIYWVYAFHVSVGTDKTSTYGDQRISCTNQFSLTTWIPVMCFHYPVPCHCPQKYIPFVLVCITFHDMISVHSSCPVTWSEDQADLEFR